MQTAKDAENIYLVPYNKVKRVKNEHYFLPYPKLSSLNRKFPKEILGDLIVTNEGLVDGSVQGENLTDFYNNRAKYLSESYGSTITNYFEKIVTEFNEIQ